MISKKNSPQINKESRLFRKLEITTNQITMSNLSKSDARLNKLIAFRNEFYRKKAAKVKIKKPTVRFLSEDEKAEIGRQKLKSLIKKANGCGIWQGNICGNGYGTLRYNKKVWRAHRLSYTLFKGKIKEGLLACHRCDNPSCINPDHLFLGTPKENMQDCMKKGRHVSGGQFFRPFKRTLSEPVYKYSELKLYPSDFDLQKMWFIGYTVTHLATGSKTRKQIRGKINNGDTKEKRIETAQNLIAGIISEISKAKFALY